MKRRRFLVGFAIGSLLSAGLAFGVTQASAASGNPTYYACLKGGKLSQVGAIPPHCKAPATPISLGANGTNVIVSPSTPYGSCNSGDTDIALSTDEVWSCLAGNWTDTGATSRARRVHRVRLDLKGHKALRAQPALPAPQGQRGLPVRRTSGLAQAPTKGTSTPSKLSLIFPAP